VKVPFATDAWEQCLYWQNADRKILKRINLLIRDIIRGDSDGGMGKPERLRGISLDFHPGGSTMYTGWSIGSTLIRTAC
jgi:Txe/YoeB family toxin of Txe-Axe toxin-antitoxin module